MNNVQLFNKTNEKYLILYMPTPLQDILRKLAALKDHDTNSDFQQLFEVLTSKKSNT